MNIDSSDLACRHNRRHKCTRDRPIFGNLRPASSQRKDGISISNKGRSERFSIGNLQPREIIFNKPHLDIGTPDKGPTQSSVKKHIDQSEATMHVPSNGWIARAFQNNLQKLEREVGTPVSDNSFAVGPSPPVSGNKFLGQRGAYRLHLAVCKCGRREREIKKACSHLPACTAVWSRTGSSTFGRIGLLN
jgi:hypothetical protein